MSSAPIRGARVTFKRFGTRTGAASAQGLIASVTLALLALAMGCGNVSAPRRGGSDARGLLLVDDGGSGPTPDHYVPPSTYDLGLSPDGQAPPPDTQAVQPATVVLTVSGMTWSTWPPKVRAAVVALNGVIDATVTLTPPEAKVTYWPNKVTVQQIIQAIQNAGFGASVK